MYANLQWLHFKLISKTKFIYTFTCNLFFIYPSWLVILILISKKDIAIIVKASILKTVKLQAALPKRNFHEEFFLVVFRVSVLSKCFEWSIIYDFIKQDSTSEVFGKMWYVLIFLGQEIYICLVSQIIIFAVELCKIYLDKYCNFFQNTGKIS